jgi:hypothetical protein
VSSEFDISKIPTHTPRAAVPPRVRISLPKHGEGERFLRGPIPMAWLCAAASLPGKALHVAIMLWHLAGLLRRADVPFSFTAMQKMGVSRYAARRGLLQLEKKGLVGADCGRGRKARVTILPAPADTESAHEDHAQPVSTDTVHAKEQTHA